MEPSVLVFIMLLILAGFAALWYFVSKDFARIAADKGYTDKRYFHYCFWLGLVGVLMITAMPDRRPGSAAPTMPAPPVPVDPQETAAVPEEPCCEPEQPAGASPAGDSDAAPRKPFFPVKLPGGGRASKADDATWKCTCRARNPISVDVCEQCNGTWRCVCGHVNPRKEKRCASCWAWRCICGKTNLPSRGMCESCNAAKPR